MRHVALLLLALAACADDPGPPTHPPLIGTWAVEWTCVDRAPRQPCPESGPAGAMGESTSVTIGAHSEIWWSAGAEHASSPDGICAVVDAAPDDGLGRSAYAICARADGTANIPSVEIDRFGAECSCVALLTRL